MDLPQAIRSGDEDTAVIAGACSYHGSDEDMLTDYGLIAEDIARDEFETDDPAVADAVAERLYDMLTLGDERLWVARREYADELRYGV